MLDALEGSRAVVGVDRSGGVLEMIPPDVKQSDGDESYFAKPITVALEGSEGLERRIWSEVGRGALESDHAPGSARQTKKRYASRCEEEIGSPDGIRTRDLRLERPAS